MDLTVLIVEDDEVSRSGLADYLFMEGYKVFEAENLNTALSLLNSNRIDMVLSDLKLPDGTGLDLLKFIKKQNEAIEVLITTGFSSVKSAVEAIKLGAYDYITKPINLEELTIILKRIVSKQKLIDEINSLKTRLEDKFSFGNLITKSKKMIDLINTAVAVSGTNSTVLIEGESGTGKELMANIIVNSSPRKDRPFIKLNCAALSETILESELFGHEKGAFTSADSLHKGRFEIADCGTIFLDEIGEIPLRTQTKILRVIQEKEFERVGGNKTIKVDIRIIAASQDIEKKVKSGEFRQDLYYRLNVINLKLPPLRERKEDIPIIVKKFIDDFSKETGKNINSINDKALKIILDYDFPGNVRELKNIIEFMTALSNNNIIDETVLPGYLKEKNTAFLNQAASDNLDINGIGDARRFDPPKPKSLDQISNKLVHEYIKIPLDFTLEEAEELIIQKTLQKNSYNKVKTAKDLNIGLKTLYRKLNDMSSSV